MQQGLQYSRGYKTPTLIKIYTIIKFRKYILLQYKITDLTYIDFNKTIISFTQEFDTCIIHITLKQCRLKKYCHSNGNGIKDCWYE